MRADRHHLASFTVWGSIVVLLALLLQAPACDSGETQNGGTGANGTGANTGTGNGGTGGDGNSGTGNTGNTEVTLSNIQVTPGETILEVDLNTPGSQQFQAFAHYSDGSSKEVSEVATWGSSAVGTFNGYQLDIPASDKVGATTTIVSATFEGATGQAQLTVVTYRMTGPQTDFFYILPFEDKMGPQIKPLDFSTDVKALDVFFAMDVTGSMDDEIATLQLTLPYLVIPAIKDSVPNTWFGAGAYMDFPVDGYGAEKGTDCGKGGQPTPDQPFVLFQEITKSAALIQAGVDKYSDANGYAIGCGGKKDRPESLLEGVYQAATGDGHNGPGLTAVAANHDGVGGVNFRKGSMPLIVPIGDAASHTIGENKICDRPDPFTDFATDYQGTVAGVAHSRQQTKDALNNICAKVMGITSIDNPTWPDNCFSLVDVEDLATATESLVPPEAWDVPSRPAGCPAGQCCTNFDGTGRAPDQNGLCPLAFKVDQYGNGLSTSIAQGVQMLTRFAKFDVTTELVGETKGVNGEMLPANTTTADFIVTVDPDHFVKPPPPPNLPDPIKTQTGFDDVTPGTTVSFTVTAFNDFVKQTQKAQFFKATIKVLAGGCTDLDERAVFILVPPAPLEIPK